MARQIAPVEALYLHPINSWIALPRKFNVSQLGMSAYEVYFGDETQPCQSDREATAAMRAHLIRA